MTLDDCYFYDALMSRAPIEFLLAMHIIALEANGFD